jgi:septum formation protein
MNIRAERQEHFRGKNRRECIIPRVRLVLASASPRRRELLAAAGFDFEIAVASVDETPAPNEPAPSYVLRVARAKAEAVRPRHHKHPVLGADTTVVVDDELLGKPKDAEDAARMLRRLSGRSHDVWTGLALAWRGEIFTATERTVVWVSELSDAELRAYVASGEPMDKAGAYAIQGLASRYVPRIEGSYSNVVGLPVATLARLLKQAGVP